MHISIKPTYRQYVEINTRVPSRCKMSSCSKCSCAILCVFIYCVFIVGSVELLSSIPKRRADSSIAPRSPACAKGSKQCSFNDTSLRFLLIGDTGGLPIYPYTTIAQGTVRDQMAKLAEEKAVQLVLNVGDNIYFTGVKDEFDARFETSFEDVYKNSAFDGIPFYTIAGNHDHFGNVSAQISYSKYSKKWYFPNYWYKLNYTLLDGTTIDFVMIDTIILAGNTADVEYGTLWDLLWKGNKVPDGPKNISLAEEQWRWIETTLNASKADYLFVGGHYPVFSASSHGPTQMLVQRLKPLLERYDVTAYFAGHDHTLQHFVVQSDDLSHSVNYILSGAASRTDRSSKHINSCPHDTLKFRYPSGWNPLSQLGFSNGGLVYVEVGKKSAQFIFMNGKGSVKYEATLHPRAKAIVVARNSPHEL